MCAREKVPVQVNIASGAKYYFIMINNIKSSEYKKDAKQVNVSLWRFNKGCQMV